MGSPKKRKGGEEGILEPIIVENFLNLGKETGDQVQQTQGNPLKINKNRSAPRDIIVKLPNLRDKENPESSSGQEFHKLQG